MAKSGTWGDHVTLQVTIAVDNTPHHPRPSRMLLSRPHLLLDLIVTCSVPILMGFMNYMASSKYFLPLSQNLSPFPLFLPTPPSFSTSTSFRVIRLPSTASTTHLPPLPPCLQAAADHFGLRIMVVTSFFESPVIYIEPAATRSPRTLYLSFWAEVHYNSLYPAQDPHYPHVPGLTLDSFGGPGAASAALDAFGPRLRLPLPRRRQGPQGARQPNTGPGGAGGGEGQVAPPQPAGEPLNLLTRNATQRNAPPGGGRRI
ncbi:hypothetical protein Vafri_5896 [Volvox africanus]|nr:hypothetical protein Vafri_5896 [Volvox africanus]